MLDWIRKKNPRVSSAHAVDEIADEAERDLDAFIEPLDWAPTVPMPAPPALDSDVPRRASEIRRLAALEARGEAAYQYIVDTAARICGMPLAGISLLDGDTVSIKAATGLPLMSVHVAAAPCWFAMNAEEPVTVFPDVKRDERFFGSPVTAGDRPLRFYAGARLLSGFEVPLGTVWVGDHCERDLSPVQLRTLELLARQTTLLMETRARNRLQPSY